MSYYSLFRVRSWNNGMRCMSLYIFTKLWYGRIASWDIRVLVVFARIWPPVTDMQHYYHARYPTDDWHLACMFSLVYFSVEVCLVGVFPHAVSIWSDPCVRACVPFMNWRPPPHEKTISYKGWPGSTLEPSEGAFEMTHGSACIIGWESGLLDIVIPPYIAQFFWGMSWAGYIWP